MGLHPPVQFFPEGRTELPKLSEFVELYVALFQFAADEVGVGLCAGRRLSAGRLRRVVELDGLHDPRQLRNGVTQRPVPHALAHQVPHTGFQHVGLVTDHERRVVDERAGELARGGRIERVVVVPDDDLDVAEHRAHHRVGARAVARRERDQLLGVDEPLVGEVERDRLGGVAVLREVGEVLRVERAVLRPARRAVAVRLRVGAIGCRFASGLEVVGAARAGIGDADLLAPGVVGERGGRRRSAVADEVTGALAEPLTAVVHALVVDAGAVLPRVRADVRFPDEGQARDGPVILGEILVDGPEVRLELPELLFDARQDEHPLERRVRVANSVQPCREREHRFPGPAGALEREEAAGLGCLDRGLHAVALFRIGLGVAEDVAPAHYRFLRRGEFRHVDRCSCPGI
jgi:hypothetical protein